MIVHLSPAEFSPQGVVGGGERYPLELARAMATKRPARLVVFTRGAPRRWVEPGGLEVVAVSTPWWFRGNPSNPVSLSFLGALRGAAAIHAHQFNTLVGNLAQAWGALTGTPVFFTDLAGGGFNLNRWLPLLRLAAGALCISRFSADYLARVHRVRPGRLRVIFGGVDLDRYPFTETQAGRRRAVFLGRLVPHKGVEHLLEGLPAGWEAVVVGTPYDPAYGARLRELAAGRPVRFEAGLGDQEVRDLVQGAGALVLPTRPISQRPELLGLVLVEAQALGTPVVATRVGALPEVVLDGETGLLVDPDSPDQIAAALGRLEDAAFARGLARRARERVERVFTWDACAAACLAAYEELGGVPS